MGQLNYVYRYISNGKTVYVGITNNLRKRVKQHQKDKLGTLQNPVIEYFCVPTRCEAEILETYLINAYKTYRYFNVAKASTDKVSIFESVHFPWKLFSDEEPINKVFFDVRRRDTKPCPVPHATVVEHISQVEKIRENIQNERKECILDIECIKDYIQRCDGTEVEIGIMTKFIAKKDLQLHSSLLSLLEELLTATYPNTRTRNIRTILGDIKQIKDKIDDFYFSNFHTEKYISQRMQFVFNFLNETVQFENVG